MCVRERVVSGARCRCVCVWERERERERKRDRQKGQDDLLKTIT